MRGLSILVGLAVASALSGCVGTMTGMGGESTYACKAPSGVLCTSMAGVYSNSIQNNLPSQLQAEHRVPQENAPAPAPVPERPSSTQWRAVADSGVPIRSAPRNLRVWISPWEDNDGDFRDQSYVYVTVDSGRWLLEHNRRAIADEYAPARPQRVAQMPRVPADKTADSGEPVPPPQKPAQTAASPAPAFSPSSIASGIRAFMNGGRAATTDAIHAQ